MSLREKILDLVREYQDRFDKQKESLNQTKKNIERTLELFDRQMNDESVRRNREINQLTSERRYVEARIEELEELIENLKSTEPETRQKAYDFIYKELDLRLAKYFETKQHPAINASEEVKKYARENRSLKKEIDNLKAEIAERWAIEPEEHEDFEDNIDDEETVRSFISKNDYAKLTTVERYQLALDNYLKKNHSKGYIGKMYERQIGHMYESEGYRVEYRGIRLGLQDGGIDLICKGHNEIRIVQCKCWKQESTVYMKYLTQLMGSMFYYSLVNLSNELFDITKPVFVTTTKLDDEAMKVAKALKIEVQYISLDKTYPMIKCNIAQDGEKIYHLPFDQQYDNTMIYKPGECYVKTVAEAERLGFRRAHKHIN